VAGSDVHVTMTWKIADNVAHTRRFLMPCMSVRRDLLNGLMLIAVIAAVLSSGEASNDVFASTEHLRLLADNERALVGAVHRYVANERQRLQHIVRYDH